MFLCEFPPPLAIQGMLTGSSIVDFVRRVAEYPAQGILAQATASTGLDNIQATKVGAWLTNQVATEWDSVSKYRGASSYTVR